MVAQGAGVRVERSLTRNEDSSSPPATSKFTAFILSDVRLYREGLAWSLAGEGSLDPVGSAEPSESTLERLVSLAPDVIILDMAVRDALEIARTLRARLPRAKIVAFAVSNVDTEIVSCAMAGICGYVRRDGTVDDLVKEVLNAVRGELHCASRGPATRTGRLAQLWRLRRQGVGPRYRRSVAIPDRARARDPGLRGQGIVEQGNREGAGYQLVNGEESYSQHPREAPREPPHAGVGLHAGASDQTHVPRLVMACLSSWALNRPPDFLHKT